MGEGKKVKSVSLLALGVFLSGPAFQFCKYIKPCKVYWVRLKVSQFSDGEPDNHQFQRYHTWFQIYQTSYKPEKTAHFPCTMWLSDICTIFTPDTCRLLRQMKSKKFPTFHPSWITNGPKQRAYLAKRYLNDKYKWIEVSGYKIKDYRKFFGTFIMSLNALVTHVFKCHYMYYSVRLTKNTMNPLFIIYFISWKDNCLHDLHYT